MLPTHREHFKELSDFVRFTIESSDVIEDLRITVRDAATGKPLWHKKRFLGDDEIVEHVTESTTSKICWTIHRPIRGWYIRIRSPSFNPHVFIPLTPVPSDSPFHSDAALSFSCRTYLPKTLSPRILNENPLEVSSSSSTTATVDPEKHSVDITQDHSYPPTPPAISSPSRPLSSELSPSRSSESALRFTDMPSASLPSSSKAGEVRQFILAPHSLPPVVEPEHSSLISRAFSVLKNSKPSHSTSFTLFPALQPGDPKEGLSSSNAPSPAPKHIRPDPLVRYHDRSSTFRLGSATGHLELDTALEREFGIDRSFWIAVCLAYLEFLTEREGYLAASAD